MLKHKSTQRLLVAAYFLILLFSCKCFSFYTVKGRAYTGNPFVATDSEELLYAEVDISYSFDENHHLNFFQISLFNAESQTDFVLIESSPALLNVLNQTIQFPHGVTYVDGLIPDFQMPELQDGKPVYSRLTHRQMGSISASKHSEINNGLHLRRFYSGERRILGVLSTDEPLREEDAFTSFVAFSFSEGALHVRILNEFSNNLEAATQVYARSRDRKGKDDDHDPRGMGGAKVMVNSVYQKNENNTYESILGTYGALQYLKLLDIKSDWFDFQR